MDAEARPVTSASSFAARRAALCERFDGPAALASGLPRVRNFQGSHYPHRAESHFLYFVGRHLEGAVLAFDGGVATLFVETGGEDAALWHGPAPSNAELERELGLAVRPLADLPAREYATLPPQDGDSADWLAAVLDRDVEAGAGDAVSGRDALLADAMVALRLVHDAAGIVQMRDAVDHSIRAHRAGMRVTRPGAFEREMRAAMEASVHAAGLDLAYRSIVTTHGDVLHCEQTHRLMRAGDLLLVDLGAESAEGWASDLTRTWPVGGQFSASQRVLYDLVLDAHTAAVDAVRPGVRFVDVHRRAGRCIVDGLCELGVLQGDADELFEAGAAALFFPHGVGHLLGLDVHDMEDLGDRAGYAPGRARSLAPADRLLRLDRDLEAGMVITIEPGFYRIPALLEQAPPALEGAINRGELDRYADVRGIRIEDDVLVTALGSELLSSALPRAAAEIEACCGEIEP